MCVKVCAKKKSEVERNACAIDFFPHPKYCGHFAAIHIVKETQHGLLCLFLKRLPAQNMAQSKIARRAMAAVSFPHQSVSTGM